MARQKTRKSLLGRAFRFFLLLAVVGGGAGAWLYLKPFKTPLEALAEVGEAHTPDGWLPVISQGFDYELGAIAFLDAEGRLVPACQAPPSGGVQPKRRRERIDYEQVIESSSALALAAVLGKAAGASPLEQAFRSSAKIRVKVQTVVTENYFVEQLGQLQALVSGGCASAINASQDQQALWVLGTRYFEGVEISLLDERGNVIGLEGNAAGSGSFQAGSSGSFTLKATAPIPVCVRPWKFARQTGPGAMRVSGGGAPIETEGEFSASELRALKRKMRSR